MTTKRREKVFGPGKAVPLDGNAKARINQYCAAYDRIHKRPGQHGALGRTTLDVLRALLWSFHNSRSGSCFPSYETIATRAHCARSSVAEAIKALEFAGALTWQHRITRIRQRCRDLLGTEGWRWRVIRTSNAYQFIDPNAAVQAGIPSKSENRTGTPTQEVLNTTQTPRTDTESPLQRALARLSAAIATKSGIEEATG